MAIRRTYSIRVPLLALLCAAESLGGHLASKLSLFGTQEETLTDELCDMWFVWSRLLATIPAPGLFGQPFDLVVSQSTKPVEHEQGFDLGIRLLTPAGAKYAIIQSKVLDPDTLRLRCANRSGWKKLRRQVLKMRAVADGVGCDLVYIAAYLPTSLLSNQISSLTSRLPVSVISLPGSLPTVETFEASFLEEPNYSLTAQLGLAHGVSLIHDQQIIGPDDLWIQKSLNPDPIRRTDQGLFPEPISLTDLLLGMMKCEIGTMHDRSNYSDDWRGRLKGGGYVDQGFSIPVKRQIDIQFPSQSDMSWEEFQALLRRID